MKLLKPSIFIIIVALSSIALFTPIFPASAQQTTMTIPELQAKIQEIMAAIQQLQILLNQAKGGISVDLSRIPSTYSFPSFLELKSDQCSGHVKYLQIFLNSNPGTKLSDTGPGSPNNETLCYGPKTNLAVIKFQEEYKQDILTPLGLTKGTGITGSKTITKINEILTEYRKKPTPVTTPTPTPTPTTPIRCGNNIKETGETCDGTDLANFGNGLNKCILYSSSYKSGNLSCSSDCKTIITSNCVQKSILIPTLYVNLTTSLTSSNWSKSISGQSPLTGADLKADVTGTTTGSINYSFDCTNDGIWDSPDNNQYKGITATTKEFTNGCSYSTPGNYTARVRVERNVAPPAYDFVTITVSQPAPGCGDGTCSGSETCSTCPGDCWACPSVNTYFRDLDGDGFGNLADTTQAASQPSGYVSNSNDCDDNNASIYSSMTAFNDTNKDGCGDTQVTICTNGTIPSGYYSNNTVTEDCRYQGLANSMEFKGVFDYDGGVIWDESGGYISEYLRRLDLAKQWGVNVLQIYDDGWARTILSNSTIRQKLTDYNIKVVVPVFFEGGVLITPMNSTTTSVTFEHSSYYGDSAFTNGNYIDTSNKTFWLDDECIKFDNFTNSCPTYSSESPCNITFNITQRGCDGTVATSHNLGAVPVNAEKIDSYMKKLMPYKDNIFGYYALDDLPFHDGTHPEVVVNLDGLRKIKHTVIRANDPSSDRPIIYGLMEPVSYNPLANPQFMGTANLTYVDAVAPYIYPWRPFTWWNNLNRLDQAFSIIHTMEANSKQVKIYPLIQTFGSPVDRDYRMPSKDEVKQETRKYLDLGVNGIFYYEMAGEGIMSNQNLSDAVTEFKINK